jgi:iron complex outermembrane receptor protein
MRVYSRNIGKASPLILALTVLVISASGHAQPVSPEGEKPSNLRTIEEVIVTAQKKAEPIQDVPISMTYLGCVELEERALCNMYEITAVAPNVIVNTSNLNYVFYVRGMGTENPSFA